MVEKQKESTNPEYLLTKKIHKFRDEMKNYIKLLFTGELPPAFMDYPYKDLYPEIVDRNNLVSYAAVCRDLLEYAYDKKEINSVIVEKLKDRTFGVWEQTPSEFLDEFIEDSKKYWNTRSGGSCVLSFSVAKEYINLAKYCLSPENHNIEDYIEISDVKDESKGFLKRKLGGLLSDLK